MSTDYYLCCEHCKKAYWIGQVGMSGAVLYTGEPDCMRGLSPFFAEHFLHGPLEILPEHPVIDDEYRHVEWPRSPESATTKTKASE